MQKSWPNPIVTQIEQLKAFYPAEEYHQNYYLNNPSAPYCQIVINPKLNKFKKQFGHLIKI
jgi:peptide-methionine (S)-S-oxide reductase